MVDWKDPNLIAYVFFLYQQISIFMLGFFGTQFVNTLNVEWELITRKRAFRIVHVPYLLARYITLTALLFFVISSRVKIRIACDPVYRIFASLGSLAGTFASLIICSRPVAIFWTLKHHTPLYLLGLGALVQGFLTVAQGIWTVRARWDAAANSCAVVAWSTTFLALFYLYTFIYDLLILCATLCAVRRVHEEQSARRWRVGDVLCVQGIGYVAVTCTANMPVAILAFLNLNTAMDVLLSQAAMTISVIASSLAFLGLEDLGSQRPKPGADIPTLSTTGDPHSGRFSGAPAVTSAGLVTTHIAMHLSAMQGDSVPEFDPAAAVGLVPSNRDRDKTDSDANVARGSAAAAAAAARASGDGDAGSPVRGPDRV